MATAMEQLSDDQIKQVGVWAKLVDDAFEGVGQRFGAMVAKYGNEFPRLADYNAEWNEYRTRWVSRLASSRDVASAQIVLFRRFDQVYLDVMENSAAPEDHKGVVIEFHESIDGEHHRSEQVFEGFRLLKWDIEDQLVKGLDRFIEHEGIQFLPEAERLKGVINGLEAEIAA